ncbi:hypothetical protein O5D80_001444 [Batrachochytrium dendrobatidis]|nr:hypothetical protein O5D80_001444 [Batrachochytrium dendrobatidis]
MESLSLEKPIILPQVNSSLDCLYPPDIRSAMTPTIDNTSETYSHSQQQQLDTQLPKMSDIPIIGESALQSESPAKIEPLNDSSNTFVVSNVPSPNEKQQAKINTRPSKTALWKDITKTTQDNILDKSSLQDITNSTLDSVHIHCAALTSLDTPSISPVNSLKSGIWSGLKKHTLKPSRSSKATLTTPISVINQVERTKTLCKSRADAQNKCNTDQNQLERMPDTDVVQKIRSYFQFSTPVPAYAKNLPKHDLFGSTMEMSIQNIIYSIKKTRTSSRLQNSSVDKKDHTFSTALADMDSLLDMHHCMQPSKKKMRKDAPKYPTISVPKNALAGDVPDLFQSLSNSDSDMAVSGTLSPILHRTRHSRDIVKPTNNTVKGNMTPHISLFYKKAAVLSKKLRSGTPATVQDRKAIRESADIMLTHSIHEDGPPTWGKVSSLTQTLWNSIPEMAKLYNSKQYLVSGLYSSFRFKKTGQLKSTAKKNFAFPLPFQSGNAILNTDVDFELPYDLQHFVKICNGVEGMRTLFNEEEASPFIHIQKNVWVDRRPLDVPFDFESICQCKLPKDGSPPCGDDCINRCLFIECGDNCPMGDCCTNRAFRRNEQIEKLRVFYAPNRGFGLYTDVPIKAGVLIIEYRGEIISTAKCIERNDTIYSGQKNHYFLEYGNGLVLDGCRKGTIARFANHSCDPNCHVEKWYVGTEFRVGIFATNNISVGSELTYDYRFDSYGQMQPCYCGSQNCRGFICINKKAPAGDTASKSKASHTSNKLSSASNVALQQENRSALLAHRLYLEKKQKQESQESREQAVHGRTLRALQRRRSIDLT